MTNPETERGGMPDVIYLDNDTATTAGTRPCDDSTAYTRTDIHQAALAERAYWTQKYSAEANQNVALKKEIADLRWFQEEVVRVYFDPTISQIESEAAIHRMLSEASDRIAAYQAYKEKMDD